MTFEHLLERFSSIEGIAEYFGISIQAVYRWKRNGVPEDRVREIKLNDLTQSQKAS